MREAKVLRKLGTDGLKICCNLKERGVGGSLRKEGVICDVQRR